MERRERMEREGYQQTVFIRIVDHCFKGRFPDVFLRIARRRRRRRRRRDWERDLGLIRFVELSHDLLDVEIECVVVDVLDRNA